MKRLLVLAYFFPPIGGGGCQRTLKLVRYLVPHGWESTVVTARDADYWILDPSLLEEVPASAEVLCVAGMTSLRMLRLFTQRGGRIESPQARRDPQTFRALRRLQSWILIPDGYLPWAKAAGRAGAGRIERGGIDAVWTTSSPESAHLAGLAIKRRFHLPWVADFRDPWVGRVTYHPPTPWHDARHRSLERDVVHRADRVTVVSEAMAGLYRARYPDLPADRFVTLPNGYDPDDWRRAERVAAPAAERGKGRFVLLHAGQLAHRPTARTLLVAVERVTAVDPRAASDLTVRFLGGNEEIDSEEIRSLTSSGVVELEPSRPHVEALAEMRRAQALVLLGHGGVADSLLYTGKIYEYLTSGRRVLGLLGPGPAADLIRASSAGVVCGPEDAGRAAETIATWLAEWRRSGALPDVPRPADASSWERPALAGRAAGVLDGLLKPTKN
ncbi:MAG: glycosyltransferase [Candidatus Eiseniibacteriota bacterium]